MELWFILAQVMGVITICIEFASYQIKNHRRYLLCTSVANVFWALMFLFMGLHTSMGIAIIMLLAAGFGVLRGLVFWWIFAKESKKRKIAGRSVLVVSMIILLVAAVIAIINLDTTTQKIIQGLGLLTGLLFVVGQYLPSKHYLRVFVFMYATMVLIGNTPLVLIDNYGVGHWNIMGIAIELSKILSVAIFYIIYAHRFAKNKHLIAEIKQKSPIWKENLLTPVEFEQHVDAEAAKTADKKIVINDMFMVDSINEKKID